MTGRYDSDDDTGVVEPVAEDPRLNALLRAELEAEVSRRDAEWSGFSTAILGRLDQAYELDAAVPVALRAASDTEIASRDWTMFGAAIDSRLSTDEVSLSPAVTEALASASEAEVSSRDWAAFAAAIEARIEREIEAELAVTSGAAELVRADSAQVLSDRERDWSRFGGELAGAEATEEGQRLKNEVRGELHVLESSFEGPFRAQVERRIASQPAPRRERAARAPHRAQRWRWVTAAMAAAAAVVAVVLSRPVVDPGAEPDPVTDPVPLARGEVQVDEVSFEGTVTITQENGVAIVWLADASS